MYELDKAAFGRFLAQLRREKGMTQKELAATLYVSDKAVSKWERGQKEERNNCPFLTKDHCAIHDAEPLVCALYPLAQEISREGEVRYFLQPTGCGGTVFAARVEDYLARYDVPAREKTDVRWAQTCMELEDVVEPLDAALEPPLRRRMQAKLWQALYFRFDYGRAYLPQLEANLVWLDEALQKLTEYQQRRNAHRKK